MIDLAGRVPQTVNMACTQPIPVLPSITLDERSSPSVESPPLSVITRWRSGSGHIVLTIVSTLFVGPTEAAWGKEVRVRTAIQAERVVRARVVDIATSQLGVREATGHNDGLPSLRYAQGRREPWCAHFVVWVLGQVEVEVPGDRSRLANVTYMQIQMAMHGRFYLSSPKPGDLIFLRTGPHRRGRHVGFITRVRGGYISTIEGNSSNAVKTRRYSIRNERIVGFASIL